MFKSYYHLQLHSDTSKAFSFPFWPHWLIPECERSSPHEPKKILSFENQLLHFISFLQLQNLGYFIQQSYNQELTIKYNTQQIFSDESLYSLDSWFVGFFAEQSSANYWAN